MSAENVIALIKQHGLYGLCEQDGCLCCNFEVHNIHVGVSCRKSEQCVRVYSHHLCRDPHDLQAVMRVVLEQLAAGEDDEEDRVVYRIRFCEYKCDHQNGKRINGKWVESQICCYCEKHREDPQEYLCIMCRQNSPRAWDLYPWVEDGFLNAVNMRDGEVTLESIQAMMMPPEKSSAHPSAETSKKCIHCGVVNPIGAVSCCRCGQQL